MEQKSLRPERNQITIEVVDGPPGSGKSTTIIRNATEGVWKDQRLAVVTYTKAAARVLSLRAPWLEAGTIYVLSWPWVKAAAPASALTAGGRSGFIRRVTKKAYNTRPMTDWRDPALVQYLLESPSKTPVSLYTEHSAAVHGWNSVATPECPIQLDDLSPKFELEFVLGVAHWVRQGCPMPDSKRFDLLVIDEAQDMSSLELNACIGMVKKGGRIICYGDPGQSIYGFSKGIDPKRLPPAWEMADLKTTLNQGFRCGSAVAKLASRILAGYWDRDPACFSAKHEGTVTAFHPPRSAPNGLIMGISRSLVKQYFTHWHLEETAVVPGVSRSDTQPVLSTIHAAKGAEADVAIVLPFTRPAMQRLYAGDVELRKLLYVGVTRSRYHLHLARELRALYS